MESTSLNLKLNYILSKETKKNSYMKVTVFDGCTSNYEKRIANMDTNLQLNNINIQSASLRLQVFNHRKLLPDKHVGQVNVRVSELVSSSANHEASATYEFATSSEKAKKGVLKVSYNLTVTVAAQDLVQVLPRNSKHVASAIGNDISLFKMLPTFRTPFVSLTWS